MSYALDFIMSTIMQADRQPINFNRNHDILSIKGGCRIVLRQLTKMMTCSPVDGQRQTGISNDKHEK